MVFAVYSNRILGNGKGENMPTFKNGGQRTVVYKGIVQPPNERPREILVFFDAGMEKKLNFWVPYEQLGLELVDADNPPVPDTVLLSGTFKFDEGTERKFTLRHCDKYMLDIIMQSGRVKVFHGNSEIGAELSAQSDISYRYHVINDWEFAPFLRVVGLEDGTEATIHTEVFRTGNREMDTWH